MRGRKPIPTALKVLNGNPGHRPLNGEEPKPEGAIPPCPEHLDAIGALEWTRITPELHRLGLLTGVDMAALAAYCCAYSRWIAAETLIEKDGITFVNDKGMVRQHPAVSIARESMRLIREFGAEFGLTPSSRSRLHVEPPEQADDDDDFTRKRA